MKMNNNEPVMRSYDYYKILFIISHIITKINSMHI